MKRYEKMSKEELVKLIPFGLTCAICPLYEKEQCRLNR